MMFTLFSSCQILWMSESKRSYYINPEVTNYYVCVSVCVFVCLSALNTAKMSRTHTYDRHAKHVMYSTVPYGDVPYGTVSYNKMDVPVRYRTVFVRYRTVRYICTVTF